MKGGVSFAVAKEVGERLVADKQAEYLQHGAFLFFCVANGGVGEANDVLALLPITDKYAVVTAVGTEGINYDITNPMIVAWMKTTDAKYPFMLEGAGTDFLLIKFTSPLDDAEELARSIIQICPTVEEQLDGSVAELVEMLQTDREVMLWWD